MKDLILNMGDKFISIVAAIIYILVIIGGLGSMSESFFMGLFTLLGGIVSTTLLFYFIYNIIDMRDSLRELNAKKD